MGILYKMRIEMSQISSGKLYAFKNCLVAHNLDKRSDVTFKEILLVIFEFACFTE